MNSNAIETEEERNARWARFDAMTDQDISNAMSADPEWEGIIKVGKIADGKRVLVPVEIDRDAIEWLVSHHIDCNHLLPALIKEYIEKHS